MVLLKAQNLHWLTEYPAVDDLCAHGFLIFKIDDYILCDESRSAFTLSATALHFLRTLDHDHTLDRINSVGDYLITCCGNLMLKAKDGEEFATAIMECPNGININIVHHRNHIIISNNQQKSFSVHLKDWATAVCGLADQVSTFYQVSPPKQLPKALDEAEGFASLWSEWQMRREIGAKILTSLS